MNATLLKLLLAIVTAIAAVEAYVIINGNTPDSNNTIAQSGVGACMDGSRYNITTGVDNDGGTNIAPQLKSSLINQYVSSVTANPNAFQSCILSKKALSAIFEKDLTLNAIQCDMAATQNPQDKGKTTLIISGIRTNSFNIVDDIADSKFFFATRYCPPKCH